MNIDKIKWMVDYAEEYEITNDRITYRGSWDCIGNIIASPLYPHLLTRTIEGINRDWLEGGIFHIVQGKSFILVYKLGLSAIEKFSMDVPDQAKQSAIDYVYKQEEQQ